MINISFSTITNLIDTALVRSRFWLFFVIGTSGVVLNLLITFLLTEYIFGLQRYFFAYLIGGGVNLVYNFTLHSFVTFRTTGRHLRRFVLFVLFSLMSAGIQIVIVRTTVNIVGKEWYLLVIAATIFLLSVANFLLFRFWLFDEKTDS